MEHLYGKGRAFHAGSPPEGDLLSDEGPVIAHALCKVDDHAILFGHCLDLLGEGDYCLGRDDQEDAVSRTEDCLVSCCPDAGIEEVGREVLGIAVVAIDVLYDILFDAPEDDCIVSVPGEAFGHSCAEYPSPCYYYSVVMVQGKTPWPFGQIMVMWGMLASK